MNRPAFIRPEVDFVLKGASVAFWIVMVFALAGLAWRGLMWVFEHPGLSATVGFGLLVALFLFAELRRPFNKGSRHV
jgi:hypothetical protein